jgi:hypothetical protein
MIRQYLPNNNEKSYNAVLQKFLHLNAASELLLQNKITRTCFVLTLQRSLVKGKITVKLKTNR